MLYIFIVFCCEILFFDSAVAAGKSRLESSDSPTRIRSDIIDIKRKSQTINFLQNVVVEKDDSSLLAQKMTVFYTQNKKSSQGDKTQIKRIEANDNVKIFTEEFVGSGDSGFYDPSQNIFVLEKNVIINNGTSIASGGKFVYDITSKKGHFVGKRNETAIAGNGGDKRVVVVIGDDISEQKKSAKKNKIQHER